MTQWNDEAAKRLKRTFLVEENEMKGFTLIELLVVVLIIGILSSVALPQYQKAIIKSRFVGYMNWVDSAVKAQELFYLANGKYASRFEDLDITVHAGLVFLRGNETEEAWGNKKSGPGELLFVLGSQYAYVWMRTRYGDMEYVRYYGSQAKRLCYAPMDAAPLNGICQSLGGTLFQPVPPVWNIYRLP